MSPVPALDSPKAFVDLFFDEFGFVVDSSQYENLFQLIDIFANYSKKEKVEFSFFSPFFFPFKSFTFTKNSLVS